MRDALRKVQSGTATVQIYIVEAKILNVPEGAAGYQHTVAKRIHTGINF